MNEITIGSRTLRLPILQGGMGVGVSLSKLAGAVSAQGGMGVISSAQIGFEEPDFQRNPLEANLRALKKHIQRAKELSKGQGMIGVNIMMALQNYDSYVKAALEAGADAIISGAGMPLSLPEIAAGFSAAIAPIVSSERAAGILLKSWDKKFGRTADFLVVEGPKAGGHLGFSREQLQTITKEDFDSEVQKILTLKASYEEKYKHKIPLFVAGGITTREDVNHILSLGADGVQVASLFVATEECDAAPAYKEAYVNATAQDVVITKSPVGMPGRALRNAFMKRVEMAPQKVEHCYRCLKNCNPAETPYCITQALIQAVKGDLDNGLIFCGAEVGQIKGIRTVKEVLADLFPLS